ncbi:MULTISPECIES: DUF1993 domain-containing protein [unclassified Luteibacter]|uniref:DUF1993 domain-containing protein n=1 Tax=unclassified Luteibacter TaxID=2620188 RepID=UPI0008B74655|nr:MULTISPECIES: DUF1993 domain-containing protein [unclassified Luteibacter]MDR6937183.1 hypothetical protein [Luteibacter sp. 3190]SEO44176.1 hypothetical protein SAMN02800692_0796 [Luteibacter sp. UNC138MFCol5.1]SEW13085.1 hypothetical protein SAMN04515660_2403 [Luteibacter sp. 329MFSha]
MTISTYDASVPVFTRGFRVLADLLAKAEAHGGTDLIEARLAPDMLNLAGQIQRASDTAKFAVARIADVQPPSFEDNEATFDDLRKRIDDTVAWIGSVDRAALEAGANRDLSRKIRDSEYTFTGTTYLLTFAIPNFFFHVTTAYDILRHKGVAIGKLDYLGLDK